MKDEKVIAPPAAIDSMATLGVDCEYYDAVTKQKVSKTAIETALELGLSIEPKYTKESTSRLRLRVHYNDMEFNREEFLTFMALFDLLSGKIAALAPWQIKLLPKLSYHIESKVTKTFTGDSLIVVFPNGATGEITPKMAKLTTLFPLIPDEYFITTVALTHLGSYAVKYYPNNKTFKVGCNAVKASDLVLYFDHILEAWDMLDYRIKN